MLGIVHHIEFGEGEMTFLAFDGDDGDGGIVRADDGEGEQEGEGKKVCERGGGSATVADHDDVAVVFAENAVVIALALVAEVEEPFVKSFRDLLYVVDDLVVRESGIFFEFGIVKVFTVFDHIVDREPRVAVFVKLCAVDRAPTDLSDEIKGLYGQIVIDGDMLCGLSCSAAGGGANTVDLFIFQAFRNGISVQMSDLGEAVFSVIGVSVSDKYDFHRELLFV